MSTKFKSVSDLLKKHGKPEAVSEFEELLKGSSIVRALIAKRIKAGLTQREVAESIGITQSAVSKFEASLDCDVTLGEIARYSAAVDSPMTIQIGPPMSLVQSVKSHAFAMKHDLEKLASLASGKEEDSDFSHSVAKFFGEAGFNLMAFLVDAFDKLPASVTRAKTSQFRVLDKDLCHASDITPKASAKQKATA
ncbi:helix-turn-helix transcriptional regulator [Luteolibacter arcticus]|uniref:Helix-turn-helix transcriptional regulator n=1 Tax=Luteolibacter arcticus TaxID=1581411 RepID=A0ABT3GT30_9BACT|nr:helix-turn-helix transcriptional regulator [Luteolibacter arcticus]MCW1926630.1 helix-turn-helix transcriptional regulator [Luteolibacter arcticus]